MFCGHAFLYVLVCMLNVPARTRGEGDRERERQADRRRTTCHAISRHTHTHTQKGSHKHLTFSDCQKERTHMQTEQETVRKGV